MAHHPFSPSPPAHAVLPPSPPAIIREEDERPRTFVVAPGDGIGPEITDAVLRVLEAACPDLCPEHIVIGEKAYRNGVGSGIPAEAWDIIRRHRVLLKAPITTPEGGGYKSVNVTLRKSLGLFANVRPCPTYHPYVLTPHPGMDVVIVRENEEDTYGGIEHRQTAEVTQCLKLISRPGTERIVRYAFAYARAYGRRKVTCLTKDNIMKITDGLFHKVFDEVRQDYPDIEAEHLIVDIGTARLATVPQRFDVVVTLNLYGDILSDVVAQISGSVGLAGSANIGPQCAMFEAVHGSAPDIAGRGIANPSGLLMAAILLLVHIGRPEEATRIHNAWLTTLEDGVHTADIANERTTRERVGTRAFAEAVVARLGKRPEHLPPRRLRPARRRSVAARPDSAPPDAPPREEFPRRRRLPRLVPRGRRARPRKARPHPRRRLPQNLSSGHDHEPRHAGLARRLPGDVLHRPLALPLPSAHPRRERGRSGIPRRFASRRPLERRLRSHQNREPLRLRRRRGLLPRTGRVGQGHRPLRRRARQSGDEEPPPPRGGRRVRRPPRDAPLHAPGSKRQRSRPRPV